MAADLTDLYAKIRTVSVGPSDHRPPWIEPGHVWTGGGWKFVLRYCGRRMTVHYFCGPGVSEKPRARDVVECLCSDALGIEDTNGDFQDWALEYGYDLGRQARQTYNATVRQTERLKQFLGAEYETFLWSEAA